jgi:hypothetical protein
MTNNMKNMIILLITTILFYSCDNGEVDKIFNTFPHSSYNISFDKNGVDTARYALHDDWWIGTHIQIDDTIVTMPRCEANSRPGTCFDDILTVKYDFLQKYMEIVSIEGNWFKITKNTSIELHIAVYPNLTGKSREIGLELSDRTGMYITISQSD